MRSGRSSTASAFPTSSGATTALAGVDLSGGEQRGYAVLKDIVGGATQFLLIPTARVTGIESPELLAPDEPDYFAAAWRARTFVDQRAGRALPRDWISLAINSETGRTQDQLHIHVGHSGASPRMYRAQGDRTIRRRRRLHVVTVPGGAADHPYLAIAVKGADLDAVNPFTLLADGVAGARADMGSETLVVVGTTGADGQPGFVILADRADATQSRYLRREHTAHSGISGGC